jgi:hypothetical protein
MAALCPACAGKLRPGERDAATSIGWLPRGGGGHFPNMPPLTGLGGFMGDVLQIWRAYGTGEAD